MLAVRTDSLNALNPSYWQRAAASFFRLLALFEMRTTTLAAVSTAFVTASVELAMYHSNSKPLAGDLPVIDG